MASVTGDIFPDVLDDRWLDEPDADELQPRASPICPGDYVHLACGPGISEIIPVLHIEHGLHERVVHVLLSAHTSDRLAAPEAPRNILCSTVPATACTRATGDARRGAEHRVLEQMRHLLEDHEVRVPIETTFEAFRLRFCPHVPQETVGYRFWGHLYHPHILRETSSEVDYRLWEHLNRELPVDRPGQEREGPVAHVRAFMSDDTYDLWRLLYWSTQWRQAIAWRDTLAGVPTERIARALRTSPQRVEWFCLSTETWYGQRRAQTLRRRQLDYLETQSPRLAVAWGDGTLKPEAIAARLGVTDRQVRNLRTQARRLLAAADLLETPEAGTQR
jgi:hypothetical protein